MDLSDLTIYELADLPEEEAWRGVHASLAAFPRLSEIFNNDDLANLIARRAGGSSRLLLRLVRSDHEMWREVFEAFDLLGPLAAQSFTEKVRRDRRGNEESWLTELRFAAWLKRGGVDVTIEPAVNDGLAEFLAQTDPPTVWEIKSPLDAEAQRAEAEIMHELQGELRRLPVPVVLSVDLRDDDTLRALSLEQLSRSRSQPPKARKPRFKPGDGKRIAADILEWIKGSIPPRCRRRRFSATLPLKLHRSTASTASLVHRPTESTWAAITTSTACATSSRARPGSCLKRVGALFLWTALPRKRSMRRRWRARASAERSNVSYVARSWKIDR